jgi:hypothetical protein
VERKRQILSKRDSREAHVAPSGLRQEQNYANEMEDSVAVCREATRKMKRPPGNWTAFSFKGE